MKFFLDKVNHGQKTVQRWYILYSTKNEIFYRIFIGRQYIPSKQKNVETAMVVGYDANDLTAELMTTNIHLRYYRDDCDIDAIRDILDETDHGFEEKFIKSLIYVPVDLTIRSNKVREADVDFLNAIPL